MLQIRKSETRGVTQIDWLDSKHSFSFGHYFDPKERGFSDLLVINDDIVAPAGGFATHPHRDMEIFTYVLSGALEHKDSMGNGSVIKPGDVQMMSAGTGIRHSEFNPSESEKVHLLQIWIVPDKKGVTPRYQQVHFQDADKRGKFRAIISSDQRDGSLSVYQDTVVFAGLFDGAETASYEVKKDRFIYLHVARGELTVNELVLKAGDGARVRDPGKLLFTKGKSAEILLFDLRAREFPTLQ